MKVLIALLVPAFLCGCTKNARDAVAIDISGPRAGGYYSASISPDGRGTFTWTGLVPSDQRAGRFSLTENQLSQLRDRLRPFETKARGLSEKEEFEWEMTPCPTDDYVTDASVARVYWTRHGKRVAYLVALGCHYRRDRMLHSELRSIVASLPLQSGSTDFR